MNSIFVSHVYRGDADSYHELIQALRNWPRFSFQDKSVSDINQITSPRPRAVIRNKIASSDVFLIFTSPIVTRSEEVQFELNCAKQLEKPIVGIKPIGDRYISKVVRSSADIIVDWDIEEIVRQIRNPGSMPEKAADLPQEVDDLENAPVDSADDGVSGIRFPHPAPARPSLKEMLIGAFSFGGRPRIGSETPLALREEDNLPDSKRRN